MKTIKMVALMGGEEVVVGRCHPGEARILRKTGLAEWSKDKLVLLQPPEPVEWQGSSDTPVDEVKLRQLGPQSKGWDRASRWDPGTPVVFSRGFERSIDNILGLEKELEEIDPEHIISGIGMAGASDSFAVPPRQAPAPEDRDSPDLRSWLLEIRDRKKAGHDLYVCDDPMSRRLGFVDDVDNVVFYLSLWKIRAADESVFDGHGISKENFLDEKLRSAFIGAYEIPLPIPESEQVDTEGVTLESIWVREVEDSIEADMCEQWESSQFDTDEIPFEREDPSPEALRAWERRILAEFGTLRVREPVTAEPTLESLWAEEGLDRDREEKMRMITKLEEPEAWRGLTSGFRNMKVVKTEQEGEVEPQDPDRT